MQHLKRHNTSGEKLFQEDSVVEDFVPEKSGSRTIERNVVPEDIYSKEGRDVSFTILMDKLNENCSR